MIISERIFKFLAEKHISQKTFSEQTGIAQSTISDWKNKKTNPAADKLMVICDVLKVTPYELLSDAEDSKYRPVDYVVIDKESKDYFLLEQIRSLDEASRERLIGYLSALNDNNR